MSLARLAEQYGTDKLEHGYLPHYERHLNYCRTLNGTLLEIGVHEGGSLRMWRDWLSGWRIVGLDNNPACMIEGEERITTVLVDVSDRAAMDAAFIKSLAFDVVIDDGSHLPYDQRAAEEALWPRVKPGGWYVVEDLATVFEPAWGGEQRVPNDTWWRLAYKLHDTLVPGDVAEFHAYEEIAFMRKAG